MNALYYEAHGDPSAPALILSSGLGGSAGYWAANIAALAERFFVIAYDHRGTGRSDRGLPEVVTIDDFADDILELIDTLERPRAHIVGHAAGGIAGLALAMKAPERVDRLVVANGWAAPDLHFLRCFETRLALLRHAGVEAFLRAQPIFLYPANWIAAHDAALEAELAHQIAEFPGVAAMEKRIAALSAFDARGRLAGLGDRTLVLVADDDMLVPSDAGARLAAELGGAPIARMGWGGHACNVTDPAGFNARVIDYLTGD